MNGIPWKIVEVQKDAQQYLDNKYQKQMIVTKGVYDIENGYGAFAHPIDNEDIKFYVFYNDVNNKWMDYYINKFYEAQIEQEVTPLISNVFPKAIIHFEESFEGKLPTEDEEGKHFTDANYHFKTTITITDNQLQEQTIYKKIFDLVLVFREHNINSDIKVLIDESEEEEVLYFISSDKLEKVQSVEDIIH
jgi:hypothetical protein